MGYETLSGRADAYNPHDSVAPRNERQQLIKHIKLTDDGEVFDVMYDNELLLDDAREILRELHTGDKFEAAYMLQRAIDRGIEDMANTIEQQAVTPFEYEWDQYVLAARTA